MCTKKVVVAIVLSGVTILSCLTSCNKESPVSPAASLSGGGDGIERSSVVVDRPTVPNGIVDVTWQGETLAFWPYTGNDFSGDTQDPVNLIFVGRVRPVEIRAALLSLDGNRTAFGFPDVFPFNSTWSDAIGNVQTAYTDGDGWVGAIVQLQLGAYAPMRFHLRLIDCGQPFGASGCWTLGNAHFEITIPGTADHQVISWGLARDIVVADLVRSGLLDPNSLPTPTGVINQTSSYHEIPAIIFNGLPEELKAVCRLPSGSVTAPVPIPTDGKAAILHVAGETSVEPGNAIQAFTVQFEQVVPMPVCSEGPLDFIFLEGPLSLRKTVRIGESGRYQYASSISGRLTAVPMDVTQNPPVPVGEAFLAIISDEQRGVLNEHLARVFCESKRIAPQKRGVEKLMLKVQVSSNGDNVFRSKAQCLGPEE